MFKSIDDKLKEVGFNKIEEDKNGASYEKNVPKYGYVHCLDILHKASGRHIIQSYQKDLNKEGFNNCVGLSLYETKLALKKAKQLGFKMVKE